MKQNCLRIVCLVLGLEFGLVSALRCEQPATSPTNPPAAEQTPKKEGPSNATPPNKPKIVFQLPLRGAPASRVDGGSRGSGVSLTCLTVLAPDGTALTIQDQPSLFWYQSQPADTHFELTVLVENTVQPLLHVRLPDARKAGIQRINLADHNVKLSAGVEYEWVVALIVDQDSRSKDVVASGWIQRVEPSPSLKSQLAGATKAELPSLYAAEGIWLDALAAESDLIEARPDDKPLQEERAALLDQVGLTNAAAYAVSRAGD
jgi:Domain of Unknown Function (DUF928)